MLDHLIWQSIINIVCRLVAITVSQSIAEDKKCFLSHSVLLVGGPYCALSYPGGSICQNVLCCKRTPQNIVDAIEMPLQKVAP
jgi:hypothetical protein